MDQIDLVSMYRLDINQRLWYKYNIMCLEIIEKASIFLVVEEGK